MSSVPPSLHCRKAGPALLCAVLAMAAPESATLSAQPLLALAADTVQLDKLEVTDEMWRSAYAPAPAVGTGVLGERAPLDTPFAIASFNADLIRNQQARFISDVTKNDPSITRVQTAGTYTDSPWIRGFSASNILYDGLFGPGFTGGQFQLEGIERIEVLKGPAAFLHDSGPFSGVGGVINLVPKKPLEKPFTTLELGYQTRTLTRVHLDTGARLGSRGQFGYRLNLANADGETAVADAIERHTVAAVALDWRATDDLTLSGGFDYVDNDHPRYQNSFSIVPGVPVPAAPDPSVNRMQSWTWFDVMQTEGWLRADFRFSENWRLTSVYLKTYADRPFKSPGAPQIFSAAGDYRYSFSQVVTAKYFYDSAQTQLHGVVHTGAIKHDLTFGFSWLENENDQANASLGTGVSNLYAPVRLPELFLATPPPRGISSDVEAWSALVSDVVTFNERWSALAGARRVRVHYETFNVASGARTLDYDQTKVTPTVAVMFKPAATALLYINYAEGLERGGTAPTGTINVGEIQSPIKTEQYEFGAKWEPARRLAVSLAIFQIEKGLEYTDAVTNRYSRFGRQVHRGVELTGSGQITNGLTLLGGVMWLDAEAAKTGNPATEGRRPIGVPEWSVSFAGDWTLPLHPALTLTAGIYYASDQPVDANNSRTIPAWTRFDAGARYAATVYGRRATFILGVENVEDRHYWSTAAGGNLGLGSPRTWKAAVEFTF